MTQKWTVLPMLRVIFSLKYRRSPVPLFVARLYRQAKFVDKTSLSIVINGRCTAEKAKGKSSRGTRYSRMARNCARFVLSRSGEPGELQEGIERGKKSGI